MECNCDGNKSGDAGFGVGPRFDLETAATMIESAVAHVRREGYEVQAHPGLGVMVAHPDGRQKYITGIR